MSEVRWWMKPLEGTPTRCAHVGWDDATLWPKRCEHDAAYVVTIERATQLLCRWHTMVLMGGTDFLRVTSSTIWTCPNCLRRGTVKSSRVGATVICSYCWRQEIIGSSDHPLAVK